MKGIKFNQWLADKIAANLQSHEGCDILEIEYNQESAIVKLMDAFGYQYDIEVKVRSRLGESNDSRSAI